MFYDLSFLHWMLLLLLLPLSVGGPFISYLYLIGGSDSLELLIDMAHFLLGGSDPPTLLDQQWWLLGNITDSPRPGRVAAGRFSLRSALCNTMRMLMYPVALPSFFPPPPPSPSTFLLSSFLLLRMGSSVHTPINLLTYNRTARRRRRWGRRRRRRGRFSSFFILGQRREKDAIPSRFPSPGLFHLSFLVWVI